MPFYDAATGGFYLADQPTKPETAVEISDEYHIWLLAQQATGMQIVPDEDGNPVIAPATTLSAEEQLAADRAAMVLTRLQFALQALASGMMSEAEAIAFVGPRVIPAIGEAALLSVEEGLARSVARIRFAGAETIERNDPFIPALQAAADLTDEEVDAFFQAGMLL